MRVDKKPLPRCSGCSRWGRDWRCNCRGTGRYLECSVCDAEHRGDAACYLITGGDVHAYVCPTRECSGTAIEHALGQNYELESEVA